MPGTLRLWWSRLSLSIAATVGAFLRFWWSRPALRVIAIVVGAFLVLGIADAGLPHDKRCAYQGPKLVGCLIANHETLVGVAAALFAAVMGWRAIMGQIAADRKNTRDAERAYVTGGPGRRSADQSGRHIGIIATAMNTGKTPAFAKMVYWGICKESEWALVGKNWPRVDGAKCEAWEDVLPPQMHPEDRYPIKCTETPVPDDENYYYGTIVYRTVFGDKFETHWKHRIVRDGKALISDALPGGYSDEWVSSPEDQ